MTLDGTPRVQEAPMLELLLLVLDLLTDDTVETESGIEADPVG